MGKWLVRGGSILALVGFFLPGVLVSCSVPGTGGFLNSDTTYSLADLANESLLKQGILFLIPILLLLSLIFSFFPLNGDAPLPRWNGSLLGQAAGFLASVGLLGGSLLNLSQQASRAGNLPFSFIDLSQAIEIQPRLGLFIFAGGYLGMLAGLILQLARPTRPKMAAYSGYPAQAAPGMGVAPPLAAAHLPCSLELIQPGIAPAVVTLIGDHFMLGRGEGSDILLTDLSVSRQHAFLYFFEGRWHIEDRGSTAGMVVNGRPMRVAHLTAGDQIQLGRVTLILRG
jgi:hypothetical protein